MRISDLIRQSFRAIMTHKRRNALSTFGIAWGVAAVLILAGWGVGIRDLIRGGMADLGDNIIFAFPGHTSVGVGGYRAGKPVQIYPEDLEVIKAYGSKLKLVLPVDDFTLPVAYGTESEDRTIRGVHPDSKTLRNLQPEKGRFITPDDMEHRRRVCYLGQAVAEEIFGEDADPLGQEIRVGGVRFVVIGVLHDKSRQTANVGSRDEDVVFIPFTTGRSLFAGRRPISWVQARAFNPEQSEEAGEEIRAAMAAKYNFSPDDEEALFILPMTRYTKMIDTFTAAIAIFVAAVGVVTLAIGGIGVMNIMLVSVHERISEIGVRRAIGGTRRWIMAQFLTETAMLTLMAGLIGLIFGSLMLFTLSKLPLENFPVPVMSWGVTLTAIVVMVATAFISGITPARRAVSIPPVHAIKGETRILEPETRAKRSALPFPGIFGEVISQAVDDIKSTKLRAMLTAFGVFWGVAAVALLSGWGIGMKEAFLEDINQLGGRRTTIYPRRIESEISGLRAARQLRFTEQDIADLRENAWFIEYFAPELWMGFPVVEHRGESRAVHTLGVEPATLIIRNFEVAEGRFINQRDLTEKRKVAFLGHRVKQRLFGPAPAVGETIRIKGYVFTVVGIAVGKGEQNSINTSLDDDKILVPYTTARVLMEQEWPDYLTLHPTLSMPWEEIEDRLVAIILKNHDIESEDAVGIFSALQIREGFTKAMDALSIFLGGVGVVTLLIGSIGVANVMFVSVSQRTREVGIRRAIGARQVHIFIQFLAEAAMICLAGGLLGVLFAFLISGLLGVLPLPAFFAAPRINPFLALIILGCIVGAGILAGFAPARKAAKSNVIESLHYE
jgi:putative ABC transport system permease protein